MLSYTDDWRVLRACIAAAFFYVCADTVPVRYILGFKPDDYAVIYYRGNNDAWKGKLGLELA